MWGVGGGGCGVLANEYSCVHAAQINFVDITTYGCHGAKLSFNPPSTSYILDLLVSSVLYLDIWELQDPTHALIF
jgi:hypothetical protein